MLHSVTLLAPTQVPTCNLNHINQKKKIANIKCMLHSVTLESRLQTPHSPTFTLYKIIPKTSNKNLQACSTNLHELSKYVSKLKTNLCNHLTCMFQQNQRTIVYLQFFICKTWYKKENAQTEKGPRKEI
jgi:hypothetical protein